MKLELVSLQSYDETSFYRKKHLSRRGIMQSGCVGIGGLIVAPTLIAAPAHGQTFALILAKYLFKNSGLILAYGDLAIKVSQEFQAWIKLINAGGSKRIDQTMISSLKGNDGSIEDQETIPINIDPGLLATYRATATANYPGTKHFDFRTEADQTKLSLKVVP